MRLAMLLILLPNLAFGTPVKTRLTDTQPATGFSTVVGALAHASEEYLATSVAENREYVGGILDCKNDGYFYTVGRGDRYQAPVQFSVLTPENCKLQALWHTHGSDGKHKSLFSAADTRTVRKLKIPFYMIDAFGTIRVFRPGDKTLASTKKNKGSIFGHSKGAAAGTIVHTPPGNPGSAVGI